MRSADRRKSEDLESKFTGETREAVREIILCAGKDGTR